MLDESLIASTTARLEELDTEAETLADRIAALEDELKETKRAHGKVMEERRRVYAPLAPVSRLPYEILARTFVLGKDRYDGYGVTYKTRKEIYWVLHYPIRLSHVNRQFRHVAITTAPLWTNIYIRLVALHPRTSLYLSRSQGCLLDIRLSKLYHNTTAAHMDELFRVLLPADRWGSLRINADLQHMGSFMLRSGPAPNLRVLELKGRDYFRTVDHTSAFEGHNPLLSSMTTWCDTSSRWSAAIFPALLHLSLKVSGCTSFRILQDYLNLLQHVPDLKTLSIMGDGRCPDRDGSVPGIIRLEALESFTIGTLMPEQTYFIVSSLYMPALLNLILQFLREFPDNEWTSWDTPTPNSAFTRLSLSIKRLSFFYCDIGTDDLHKIARCFPGVDDLEFGGEANMVMKRFIHIMTYRGDVLFPELRRLKLLHGFDLSAASIEVLENFLRLCSSKSTNGLLTVLLPKHDVKDIDPEALARMDSLANFETYSGYPEDSSSGELDDSRDFDRWSDLRNEDRDEMEL